jgi:hypothetical protein
MPLSGEQVWRRRAHEVLERGGTSLEGASSPRERRDLTRGGRPALELGGGLPVQCRDPRVKWSSARGWLGRLFGGSLGPPGPWAREFILRVF